MPNGDEQFQYVKMPDGSYGKSRADASDADIRSAISKDFPDAFKGTPSLYEQARQSYEAKKGKVANPGVSEGAGLTEGLAEWDKASFGEMGGGARELMHGNVARGTHRLIRGVGNLMTPALPFVATAAPAATARTLLGGTAGGYLGRIGAEMMGASPDVTDLAGDVGGIIGGYGGGKLPSLMGRVERMRTPQSGIPSESELRGSPTPFEEMSGSEGRPATWTNERVLQLARQGNRDAIAQVARRGLQLPENARYIAGDIDYPRAVQSPREVTLFTPEGTPIRMGGKRSYLGLIPSKKMRLPDEAP